QGQNQPRRDDFGLKIGKLSHRTSIKDGLGRHIGSCGPLNRNFPKSNNPWYYSRLPAQAGSLFHYEQKQFSLINDKIANAFYSHSYFK
ncbi:hypothetical protein, partial [Enterobacter cloacae complex sp. IR5422]|uniref:hypothetical protein n=1 Tax=Enterobacter cloacae complex sp. IR5422 TaxID=3412363 RepID=UPI003B9F5891